MPASATIIQGPFGNAAAERRVVARLVELWPILRHYTNAELAALFERAGFDKPAMAELIRILRRHHVVGRVA